MMSQTGYVNRATAGSDPIVGQASLPVARRSRLWFPLLSKERVRFSYWPAIDGISREYRVTSPDPQGSRSNANWQFPLPVPTGKGHAGISYGGAGPNLV